jgi:hypothetical protein
MFTRYCRHIECRHELIEALVLGANHPEEPGSLVGG